MKILILNTSECTGGAAVAANRLMHALNKTGHEAKMLVRDKQTGDPNVVSINSNRWKKKINFLRFAWERWVIFVHNRFRKKNLFAVSIANTGTDISNHPMVKEADIIHLHWINQGFLSLKNIRQLVSSGKPVVWTMHDMWLCTGICHYAWECEKFMETCGNCDFVLYPKKKDLSYQTLKKKRFLSYSNIRIVTVSSWLKDLTEKSIVTKKMDIRIIPNIIDTSVFFPSDKQTMRGKYSFPQNKKIIIMGAAKLNDPIKGFEYLQQALLILKEQRDDLFLVLFGNVKNDRSFFSLIPIEYVFMGLLSAPSIIAQLYASADVTVVPSNYETFGQTLIESMACGCPAVSFNNSGQTDIIDHKLNGYIAEYKSAEDFAAGISWCLNHENSRQLSEQALLKVKTHYAENIAAKQYVELYTEILK